MLVGITATDLQSSSGAQGSATFSDPGGGAETGVSNGACFNVGAKIARRYRGGKPKVFIPGVQPAQLDNQQELTTAAQSAIEGGWTNFIKALVSTAYPSFAPTQAINISYYQGFKPVLNPLTGRYRNVPVLRAVPLVDVIELWSASPKLGSQRRRILI